MKSFYYLLLILPIFLFSQGNSLELELQNRKMKTFKIKDKRGKYLLEYPVPQNWQVLETEAGVVILNRAVTNDILLQVNISLGNFNYDENKKITMSECMLEPGAFWDSKNEKGYLITSFPLGSNLKAAGLKEGDIILQINSIDVKDSDSWCNTLNENEEMTVLYERNDEIEAVSVFPNTLVKGENIMSTIYDNYYALFSNEFKELGINWGRLNLNTFLKVKTNIVININSLIFIKNYNNKNEINPESFISEYSTLFRLINNYIRVK